MTPIQHKALLMLDATHTARHNDTAQWAKWFLEDYDESDPIWNAIVALEEGLVDSFSYEGVKQVESLWQKFCFVLGIMPELDYSDMDDVYDILTNWEAVRVYP